jgi:hypothetical protein
MMGKREWVVMAWTCSVVPENSLHGKSLTFLHARACGSRQPIAPIKPEVTSGLAHARQRS